MRFRSAFLLCALALVSCGKKNASAVIGTWSINSPVYGAIAFDEAGGYEINFPGDSSATKGSYIVANDTLTLSPSGAAQFSMSYKMTINGDTMSLEPVPPKGLTGTDVAFLKALAMQLKKYSTSQHLDTEVIQKAKDSAAAAGGSVPREQSDCVSQVKQICLATILYSEDYDQVLPQADWEEGVLPYIKDKALLTCPAVKQSGGENGYAMNADVVGQVIGRITDPAKHPLVFDSNSTDADAVSSTYDMPSPPRHPAGNTIGYVDGHSASVR